jgi:hypothetical protein
MQDDLAARIERVTDRDLLRRLGDAASLGRGFCFIQPGALGASLPGWMRAMLPEDEANKARIVPLFAEEPVELPGVVVEPTSWRALQLRTVTSDRALYRENDDVVELLLYAPYQQSGEGFIEIERNGAGFGRRPYRTDEFGLATTSLSGLPAGRYSVSFHDSPDDAPPCEFTVAAFRMAGLTATLVHRELRDGRLRVTVGLQSYGAPFDGAVRISVVSDGMRVDGSTFNAVEGEVKANLRADGEGPFELEIQLVDDPSRTATVPIVGSRRSEREETPVAAMDRDLAASLIPSPGAREIRGMYVTEQGSRTALFKLGDLETTQIDLTATTGLYAATAVLVTPESKPRVVHREMLDGGETWTIDFGRWGSVAVLAVAGITEDGRAWEGWTLVTAPSQLSPRLLLPDEPRPGETVEIGVTVDSEQPAEAYFVVKDARLVTPDTPSNRLAGEIKQWARDASETLGAGFVDRPLKDALDHVHDTDEYLAVNYMAGQESFGAPPPQMAARGFEQAGAFPSAAAPGAPPPVRMQSAPRPAASASAPDTEGGDSAAAEEPPSSNEQASVHFVGTAPVVDGEASVDVLLPDGFADLHVDVFVASASDWGGTEGDFHIEQLPFLATEFPRFVHADDVATARLVAFCKSGRMRVTATRDGEPIELFDDEDRVDSPIDARRAELVFLARPGEIEAAVEDLETGERWEVVRRIEEPGKLRAVAKSLRFLEPGELVTTEEDDVFALRVLPGLEEPFELLCDATADYGHACCEQTAAKMLSACMMYVFAGDDESRRSRAKRIIEAGVRREESMFLPGEGFKMYPESRPVPDEYWGSKAARYLHFLELIETDELAFGDVLARGLDMARNAADAYRLEIPASRPNNLEDAYLAIRFGDTDSASEPALRIARKQIDPPENLPVPPGGYDGAVNHRMEAAWAAAILLRVGGPGELPAALRLANEVVSQIGPEGRLYSTADSVAAIALMTELQAAGIVGASGIVEIDGDEVATADAVGAAEPSNIRCVEGRVAVEVSRIVEEDWEALRPDADVRISLAQGGNRGSRFTAGDELQLIVDIADGYETGDVLWVCLPDALSRIEGGGQVKLFSVDFAGKGRLEIPLAATSVTLGDSGEVTDQKYMVCLRNMFREERVGNPGVLGVRVEPAGTGSILDRLVGGLRRLWKT